MKTALAICLFSTFFDAAFGQYSRSTVTKPTTPYDDGKPNSDDVPDVYAISGDFERVVVLRLKHKTDLLEGLNKGVENEGIENAVILAAAGSVMGYHLHSVINREFPSENVYFKDPTHPADIVSINGYVIDGRIHAHVTLADEEKAFGGHLEPGTDVFTFAVVTLGVFTPEVSLDRVDD